MDIYKFWLKIVNFSILGIMRFFNLIKFQIQEHVNLASYDETKLLPNWRYTYEVNLSFYLQFNLLLVQKFRSFIWWIREDGADSFMLRVIHMKIIFFYDSIFFSWDSCESYVISTYICFYRHGAMKERFT